MSCPICHEPTTPRFRPFCSRRCADLDLGRWVTGSYRLPVVDDEEPPVLPGPEDPPADVH